MKHHESQLQQNCVRWFDLQYPKYKLNLFSIPNEGSRTPANGARMKAQGRRAGVADMFLAVPITTFLAKGSFGIFIEFKYGKGKQNDNQKSFEKAVVAQGYRYIVIAEFDEFKKLIEDYLE